MKRISLIIITLIYVVMSSGITLTYHYCMGRLADVKVMALADRCMSCQKKSYASYGGDKQTSPCCSDKSQLIKIKSDQNIDTHVVDLSPLSIELLPIILNEFRFLQVESALTHVEALDDPPNCIHTPLFIHHCIFLI